MAGFKRFSVFILGICLIIAAFGTLTSSAEDETVIIRIEPDTLEVNPGDTFNITIYIEKVPEEPGIAGIEFQLAWDPMILKGVSMEEVLFHSVTPESEWGNIWRLKHVVADDHVWYAYTWMDMDAAISGGYAPITGNHTLAIVTLSAISEGATTLEFTSVKIGDPDANPVPNTPLSAYIVVGNPPPEIIIISPQNNSVLNMRAIDLTFTISEDVDWIGYSLDNQDNVTIQGNTTISIPDGYHFIVVYARDTTGLIGASEKVYFIVDTTPPHVDFTFSPEEPQASLIFGSYKWELTFNASASYDLLTNITSYEWDFGDGSKDYGRVVTHIYRKQGTYEVTLKATDFAGNTATITKNITLPPPPSEPISQATLTFIIVTVTIGAVWIVALVITYKKRTANLKRLKKS